MAPRSAMYARNGGFACATHLMVVYAAPACLRRVAALLTPVSGEESNPRNLANLAGLGVRGG